MKRIQLTKPFGLLVYIQICQRCKGFCQVKKNPKIREKLGSGWVGQAPIRNIFLFWKCCVFVCLLWFSFAIHVFLLDKIAKG